jgi:hypothetical protein
MFRFTIRDVLWLTVLASVLVAWWVDDAPCGLVWRCRREVKELRAMATTLSMLVERISG